MNRRILSGAAILACLGLCALMQARAETIDENTPVPPVGEPGGPQYELDEDELDQFKRGRMVFDRDWRISQGLGTPELNADSCRACHEDPVIGGAGGLDLNVFRYGFDDGGEGEFENEPGGQVASKVRRPDIPLRDEITEDSDVFEQRQTPQVFGGGLIDTIYPDEILAHEDPDDDDGDGIAGYARLHLVDGKEEIGRFGWKAQIPTLRDFLRDALGGETGITVPDDGRGFGMLDDDDDVDNPEITEDELDDMAFFASVLAAPRRGGSSDSRVAEGEELFEEIGCAICHVPSMEGTQGDVYLYSDLLLHHVLPEDFRGMADPDAPVGYFKTPPLWGVSKTPPYFHDGRAETLRGAILTHDGEAAGVREEFEELSASDQHKIILFLEDL